MLHKSKQFYLNVANLINRAINLYNSMDKTQKIFFWIAIPSLVIWSIAWIPPHESTKYEYMQKCPSLTPALDRLMGNECAAELPPQNKNNSEGVKP